MNSNEFLNTVFDLLAQNEIDPRHQMTRAEVTELIDCVDFDKQTICFKHKDGKEFELRLVQTYAPAPKKERIVFRGIDQFNRPVFKSLDKERHFYGDVHNLFGYEATEADVLAKVTVDDLCYFGSRFDCEPYGTPVDNLEIVKK